MLLIANTIVNHAITDNQLYRKYIFGVVVGTILECQNIAQVHVHNNIVVLAYINVPSFHHQI